MSARSNENRLGAPPTPTEVDTGFKQPSMEGDSLKFITPTEFAELPSKGHFYPPDHPLFKQEVVEIKHMTTKEEDILTSVALLKKGLALDRMLESIIVDKRIKTDNLLVGDKNALLVAARAHGYGAAYETAITCPRCDATQDYSFDLSALKIQFPSDEFMAEHEIKRTEVGTFLIPLPKTQYTIEVRFLTGRDEKKILEAQAHKKKMNFPETPASDFLRLVIVSVNDIKNATSLNDFINTLPALHSRYIKRMYEKLIPSLDMNHSFSCSVCTYEGALEVPLTADFFWSIS
jgi:hypothetical protein